MKRRILLPVTTAFLLVICLAASGQTVTELVIPKFFGSKTAASANNARTAFALCVKIDGLTPATAYDLKPGIALVTEAATAYGAGNYWTGTTFSGTTGIINAFTTDATGSSGPIWVFIQPTGNASRFDAGQQHNLRLGWVTTGGTFPSSPQFVGTKILTALDIATTPRTPATTDDGCFVKGSSQGASNGKYMLMYDNENGTGDPLFAYMIIPTTPTQVSNSELPAAINDVYMQAGTAVAGDYCAVIPIGANNANGVRRVESRSADNTVFAFNTSTNGSWPSGANTTNALRRDVVVLTSGDTPLAGAGPGYPAVTTSTSVTNISFNAATGGGNVTSAGGTGITGRGICWGTGANPTIAGPHTTEPGTLGSFTSNMTGLAASTLYHYRAYATNTAGTAYGADVTFSTLCDVIAPLPDFAASKVNISVGESINFFDSTKYCPDSWNWSFNGGTPATSTLQNPTGITFTTIGDFTICLTATNQWGQQTACKNAYIHVTGPTNAPIVMTEINYRSPIVGSDSLEFIELYNNGTAAVDLHNFYFSKGIEYTFPTLMLNPQSYVIVAKSSAYMTNYFNVPSYQWNTGQALTNQGEAIVLKDLYGYVIDSVYYMPSLPWDTLANGKGPSLELCDPNSNNALAANWRHAIEYKAKLPTGDSLWASPLAGCAYLPVAGFNVSDSTISLGQSVVFTDISTGSIDSWFWEFERGVPETYSGQTPPPVSYNIMGSYDVTLTVRNTAGKSVKYKPGFIQVGPAGMEGKQIPSFSVVPNPAEQGLFSLVFSTRGNREISLVSCLGAVVETKNSQDIRVSFNLPELSAGIYFIKVRDLDSDLIKTEKIFIR